MSSPIAKTSSSKKRYQEMMATHEKEERARQARREAQALRLERETLANAATKVQAGFRGHQARKELAAMKGGEGESATEGETSAETEGGTLETERETGAETETTA